MAKPRTSRLPEQLDDCLSQRLTELEMSYSEYVTSLVAFDLSIAKPHTFTGDFHKLPGPQRDRVYEEISRAYRSGEAMGGRWADARIKEAVKEAAVPEPPKSRIAEKFRERLLKSKSSSES